MGSPSELAVEVYLAGADAILAALADPAVAAAWHGPSVLEGQLVGGLAGHLTRNGTWLVGDYLDGDPPTDPATGALPVL